MQPKQQRLTLGPVDAGAARAAVAVVVAAVAGSALALAVAGCGGSARCVHDGDCPGADTFCVEGGCAVRAALDPIALDPHVDDGDDDAAVPDKDDGDHDDGDDDGDDGDDGDDDDDGGALLPSCAALLAAHPDSPSGAYVIDAGAGPVDVTCDMDSDGGGFTVVADVQWSGDPSSCPAGWFWTIHGCAHALGGDVSVSAVFDVPVAQFHEVRGEARAFTAGFNSGFAQSHARHLSSIEAPYVDGLSISAGDPGMRVHVWTFVAGFPDGQSGGEGTAAAASLPVDDRFCPCAGGARADDLVGDHYSCESPALRILDVTDTLWDDDALDPRCDTAAESSPSFLRSDLAPTAARHLEARIMGVDDDGGALSLDPEDIYVTRLLLEVR